jgi:hypothetical protein
MTPRVSVCIPAFNAERTIAETLESLLAQTYRRIEITVADNASTDRTAQIVRSYPTVRYVRSEENLGGPANFDRCIGLAEGDYVAIYHADDVYDPRIVEREVALHEATSVALVMALDWWMTEDGVIWGRSRLPRDVPAGVPLAYEQVLVALARHTNTFLRAPTAMLRSTAARELGAWDPSYPDAGDVDLWLRLARAGGIAIIDEPLVKYRVSAGQWSARSERGRVAKSDIFNVLDAHLAHAPIPPEALAAYRAHRSADAVVRAIALARADRTAEALLVLASDAELRRPFSAAVPLRVRIHLVAGLLLRAASRAGLGRPTAAAMHAVRHSGPRSVFLRVLPRVARFRRRAAQTRSRRS